MTHRGRPRKEKPPFAPHGGRQWTRHDDVKLGALIADGMFDDEAARILGRSIAAVRTRRWVYGLDVMPRHRGEAVVKAIGPRWTRDAAERLAERFGMSLAFAAGLLMAEALKPDMAARIDRALERAREEA